MISDCHLIRAQPAMLSVGAGLCLDPALWRDRAAFAYIMERAMWGHQNYTRARVLCKEGHKLQCFACTFMLSLEQSSTAPA